MRGAFDFESNRWNHAAAPSLGNETTPREGLWIAPLPTPKRVPLRTQLILAAFFGASLLATYLSHGFLFPVVLLSALVSLILLSSPGDKPNFVPTEEDLKLLEDEGDLDVCLITLKITADGREVGRDRGAAWFSDGRFLFNGHRTSFALGGQDVFSTADRPTWAPDNGATMEVLALRHPGRHIYLEVAPLHSVGLREPAEIRFLKRLFEFRRHAPPSKELRQWPPLTA